MYWLCRNDCVGVNWMDQSAILPPIHPFIDSLMICTIIQALTMFCFAWLYVSQLTPVWNIVCYKSSNSWIFTEFPYGPFPRLRMLSKIQREYISVIMWQASAKQSYVSRPTWEVAWLLIPTPSLQSSSPNEWQPFKRGAGRELYLSVISLNTLHTVYNSAVHAATCMGSNEAYYDGYISSRGHITNNQGKRVHSGVSGTIIG